MAEDADPSATTRPIDADDLLGTWELVSVRRTVTATGEAADQFGPAPRGYLSYGRDGRVTLVYVASGRPRPGGVAMTDADRAELLARMDVMEEADVPLARLGRALGPAGHRLRTGEGQSDRGVERRRRDRQ